MLNTLQFAFWHYPPVSMMGESTSSDGARYCSKEGSSARKIRNQR
jgi:hypothetical protein